MHSDRTADADVARAALRLRLAAAALALTLVLLGGGAPAQIGLGLAAYVLVTVALRFAIPLTSRRFSTGLALLGLGVDLAGVGALVALLPLERPAWILFLFPIGIGALGYGATGAAATAAVAVVIVDVVIALRLPEAEALALWPLQLLIAAALVTAELARVRGRDAVEHDVLLRRAAALADLSGEVTSTQVLRTAAEHVFRMPGVTAAWCWVQRERAVVVEHSRGDLPAIEPPAIADVPGRGRRADLAAVAPAVAHVGQVVGLHDDPRVAIAALIGEGALPPERRDALVRDITDATARALAAAIERERAERAVGELRVALENVRSQLKAKEDAVATAVHELRTPLTSVGGYAQIVSRHLDSMQRQVAQLARLIADLQPIAGRTSELMVEPTDLRELVRGSVARARVLSDAEVRLEEPPGPLVLTVDGPRIGQVIDNLLGNAVKYSPAPASVLVTLREEDEGIRLSVTDEGRGISAEDLPRLFERGFRAAGDVRGEGLGLAVVRDVVEAHGGRVGASSPGVGQGSTFWLVLPQRQPASPPPEGGDGGVREPEPEDARRG